MIKKDLGFLSVYKWPWKENGPGVSTCSPSIVERLIYIDEFQIGGANARYDNVAPGEKPPSPELTPTPLPIIGDVNGNGCVDEIDYEAVIVHFLKIGNNVIGDINSDGIVDEIDYGAVIARFLEGCGY
jgi:hypothetical protein